jgi:hypothetical protein
VHVAPPTGRGASSAGMGTGSEMRASWTAIAIATLAASGCRYELPPDVGPKDAGDAPDGGTEPASDVCGDDQMVSAHFIVSDLQAALGSGGDVLLAWSAFGHPWTASSQDGAAYTAEALTGGPSPDQAPGISVGAAGAAWIVLPVARAVHVFHRTAGEQPFLDQPPLAHTNLPISPPRVTLDASGVATTMWASARQEPDGLVMRLWTSRFGAGEASPVLEPVGAETPSIGSFAMSATPSGDVAVVWTAMMGTSWHLLLDRYAPAHGSWAGPLEVELSAGQPGVAIGADGSVLIAWKTKAPIGWDLRARRRSAANDGWSPTEVVAAGIATSDPPAVGIDGSGRGLIGWYEQDGDTMTLRSAAWPANEAIAVHAATGRTARRPRFAVSSDGAIAAVWKECSEDGCGFATARSEDGVWSVQHASLTTDYPAAVIHDVAIAVEGTRTVVAWPLVRSDSPGMVICARVLDAVSP